MTARSNDLLKGLAIAFGVRNAPIVPPNEYADANGYWIMTVQFNDDVQTIVTAKLYTYEDMAQKIQSIKNAMDNPKVDTFAITLQ